MKLLTCKSYTSRKTYDIKIVEAVAELTYKRDYQRKITQIYRAEEPKKATMKNEFASCKSKARAELKLYREEKITADEFSDWIEENK